MVYTKGLGGVQPTGAGRSRQAFARKVPGKTHSSPAAGRDSPRSGRLFRARMAAVPLEKVAGFAEGAPRPGELSREDSKAERNNDHGGTG
jgi:hypothetical protein